VSPGYTEGVTPGYTVGYTPGYTVGYTPGYTRRYTPGRYTKEGSHLQRGLPASLKKKGNLCAEEALRLPWKKKGNLCEESLLASLREREKPLRREPPCLLRMLKRRPRALGEASFFSEVIPVSLLVLAKPCFS